MIIVQDSREQTNKHNHVLKYFAENGIKVVRSKLFVGDYTRLDNQTTCIDTKKNVVELFMDLTKDHVRFRNECIRAQEYGIKLVILIEEKLPNNDLAKWKSPVYKSNGNGHKRGEPITRANPVVMLKALKTMQAKYGVSFIFCDKADTGKVILKLLNRR